MEFSFVARPIDLKLRWVMDEGKVLNFTTSSRATILSEPSKYRPNLTIPHQYLQQLDQATAHAVFGNVGSMIAFQVGAKMPKCWRCSQVKPEDRTNLPKYTRLRPAAGR